VGNKVTLTPSELAYDEGEAISIGFTSAPGGTKDWIGIYRVDQNPGSSATAVKWDYATTASGANTFAGVPKGYYYAAFFVNDGYQEIAERVRFSVGSLISTVSMAAASIQPGQDFTVNFTNGPGIPKDWMGIFKQGQTPGVDVLTAYLYFAGASNGSVTFHLPDLPPGDYFVAMFTNDSYTEVSNRFLFSVAGKPELKIENSSIEGDSMRLRWRAENGKTYKIQKSTHLNNDWSDVRTVMSNSSSHEELIPINRASEPSCYFRVTEF
jgi:hypothetical protein